MFVVWQFVDVLAPHMSKDITRPSTIYFPCRSVLGGYDLPTMVALLAEGCGNGKLDVRQFACVLAPCVCKDIRCSSSQSTVHGEHSIWRLRIAHRGGNLSEGCGNGKVRCGRSKSFIHRYARAISPTMRPDHPHMLRGHVPNHMSAP